MVKRKYIIPSLFKTNVLLYISAIYVLGWNEYVIAEAWLPSKGTYQYSSTFSTIDKKSKTSKNRRASAAVKIRDDADVLRAIKYSIVDRA